jgi:hypothetical protein
MRYIGFEREEEAVEWAKKIIGIEGPTGFCRAVSAVDKDENFVFVIVVSNFTAINVDMHVAALPGANWATPHEIVKMFNEMFSYFFQHLKIQRVTGLVRLSNVVAQLFCKHLGFKLEGIMRRAFVDDDLCIYGFLKEDFDSHKWRRGNENG